MKVVLFGATGMVGQGVLRQCLADPDVSAVLSVGRQPLGMRSDKLSEVIHQDFADFSSIEETLTGYDACFFCLGVSSSGMSETAYARVTYDFTLAAASVLVRCNPNMVFVYVSGAGTDETEKGRSMWARIKGKTENALLRLPFRAAYMFRPGLIQPQRGIVSKTRLYRLAYVVLRPLFPLIKALAPNHVTTLDQVAQAMLIVAKRGESKKVLETVDINRIANGLGI